MIRALGIWLLMATGAQAQTGGTDALAEYMGSICQQEFTAAQNKFVSYILSGSGYQSFQNYLQAAGYDSDSMRWEQLWNRIPECDK